MLAIDSLKNLFDNIGKVESLDQFKEDLLKNEEVIRIEGAKCLLNSFIALNYGGYVSLIEDLQTKYHMPSILLDEQTTNEAEIAVSFGYNKVYHNCRGIILFYLAKLLLDSTKVYKKELTVLFYKFKLAYIWSVLLEDPEISIKDDGEEICEDIASVISRSCAGELGSMGGLEKADFVTYLLESVYFHLNFFNYEEAEKALERAMEFAGIKLELEGEMGKRTKFQETFLPQLVAKSYVTDTNLEDSSFSCTDASLLPTNVCLNDDTLLENLKLEKEIVEANLSPLQSACVLTTAYYQLRTQHKDELLLEKLNALINKVIFTQHNNWAVGAAGLMERCILEKHKGRKVERACSQAEVICKLMDGVDDKTEDGAKLQRVPLALASGLKPFWKTKIDHATILISLGCISEALSIYEALESWDSVIDCYRLLEQMGKAESLVRTLLKVKEEPVYYCYLGDITRQASYYEKAIEVSNDRSARAQKSLGELMISRENHEAAYKHLKRSVEIQPLQLGAWFNLGYCASKLENHENATNAYHRCVAIEPDHYEAWNNLAASYIKLGQKARAQKILEVALKFRFDHVKMLETYIFLCIDNGDFLGAIQAYNRILDINSVKKFNDDEVIEILIKEVQKVGKEDQLRVGMLKLLARIKATSTLSASVIRAYAVLKKPDLYTSEEGISRYCSDFHHYISDLQRAMTKDIIDADKWTDSNNDCVRACNNMINLAAEKQFILSVDKEMTKEKVFGEIRMSFSALLAKIEAVHGRMKVEGMGDEDSDDEDAFEFDESVKKELGAKMREMMSISKNLE
uniref:TPR_REGION domain-containing protein n=1 Tax=Rhabditophanes sp. KR3021 TaxID=114890 RepID=A0AC35TTU9_9BILA